jgi:signal transduction histidine kinase
MDKRVLGKVCGGLLRNAIENTPDEGRIEVEARTLKGFIEIGFKDYGVGITAVNQRLIFGGFFHTQETDHYSSGKPYRFNAGGSGSDLLRIKVFAERFGFDVGFTSQRCRFIPNDGDCCPGRISDCRFVKKGDDCLGSGMSRFCIRFATTRFEATGAALYTDGS